MDFKKFAEAYTADGSNIRYQIFHSHACPLSERNSYPHGAQWMAPVSKYNRSTEYHGGGGECQIFVPCFTLVFWFIIHIKKNVEIQFQH